MLALALLGPAATALADGRDVLADAKDNERIDGCYSRAELREALALALDNDRLYGATVDLIKDAQIDRVAVPGVACGAGPAAAGPAVQDTSGGSLAVWLGLAAVVGGVAVGAGVWAGRAGR